MKLESSHTRIICSAHFEEVRRNIPGVNPVKKGNYLEGGRLVKDVLSETDLAVGAEFEFEAVEAGVVTKRHHRQRVCRVRNTYRQWKLTTFCPLNLTVPRSKKLKQIQMGTNVKGRKRWRSQLKYSKKNISALNIEVHKREFCIKRFHEAKKFRITASQCQRLASMKESTSPVAALQEILHYKATIPN